MNPSPPRSIKNCSASKRISPLSPNFRSSAITSFANWSRLGGPNRKLSQPTRDPFASGARPEIDDSSDVAQKLHGLANLGRRIGDAFAGNREIAAILLLFEDAQELGPFGTALAERDFDTALAGDVARGIGGVDMQNVRAQRPSRFARVVAVDDQIGRIQINAERARRQTRNQRRQLRTAFRARFGRQ